MSRVAVKSLKKVPWLINYELHDDKVIYLISACKGMQLFKYWK